MKSRRLIGPLAALVTLGLVACEVEQTEEGAMPDVKVRDGQLPEYDVDAPDVEVKTEERTVTVPTVDVQSKEEGQDGQQAQPNQQPERSPQS